MNCHATGGCPTIARSCSPFRHPAGWPVFFARSMPSGPIQMYVVRQIFSSLTVSGIGWQRQKKKRSEQPTRSVPRFFQADDSVMPDHEVIDVDREVAAAEPRDYRAWKLH